MTMLLPEGLEVIHQPARLALMTLLYQRGDVGASAARAATGLTPGNLDSHAKRLVELGFVQARKTLTREGFEARYRITAKGVGAMREYLGWLEGFALRLRRPAGEPSSPP
ncbi:MAG TPA: transcriptional regulator [Candidatus Thermoplasmatota archaeon]|nr:transcriptional regulator [Candidatus Thermoplasmatota archaeon]